MSTLPKSVQAQMGGDGTEHLAFGESSSNHVRVQHIREFVQRIRNLPDDFLRVALYDSHPHQSYESNRSAQRPISIRDIPLVDAIEISVVEAQLVKNYGLLKMDLYCKIRVGHMVCETPICPNGAKNPKWSGVYEFTLQPGIDSFHLEIYDERQFSPDEKVAWLYETVPADVFRGITVERWFPLTGRLGPNKEGSVLLVLSYKRVPARPPVRLGLNPMPVYVPSHVAGPAFQPGPGMIAAIDTNQIPSHILASDQLPAPGQQVSGVTGSPRTLEVIPPGEHIQPRRPATEEEIQQLGEMFPSIDKSVIKAILENNNHDKEAAITSLLELS